MGPIETHEWAPIGPGHCADTTWWTRGPGDDGSTRDDDEKNGRGDKHVYNQQRWPKPRSQRVRKTGTTNKVI